MEKLGLGPEILTQENSKLVKVINVKKCVFVDIVKIV